MAKTTGVGRTPVEVLCTQVSAPRVLNVYPMGSVYAECFSPADVTAVAIAVGFVFATSAAIVARFVYDNYLKR